MPDDLVTKTITITVTAQPKDFETSRAGSEDLADDLIALLISASTVTLDAVTTKE